MGCFCSGHQDRVVARMRPEGGQWGAEQRGEADGGFLKESPPRGLRSPLLWGWLSAESLARSPSQKPVCSRAVWGSGSLVLQGSEFSPAARGDFAARGGQAPGT